MLDMGRTESVKASLRVLKLHRETLRELDAGVLTQERGGRQTSFCDTERRCTHGCGPFTKKC